MELLLAALGQNYSFRPKLHCLRLAHWDDFVGYRSSFLFNSHDLRVVTCRCSNDVATWQQLHRCDCVARIEHFLVPIMAHVLEQVIAYVVHQHANDRQWNYRVAVLLAQFYKRRPSV